MEYNSIKEAFGRVQRIHQRVKTKKGGDGEWSVKLNEDIFNCSIKGVKHFDDVNDDVVSAFVFFVGLKRLC
ncbi:MAG: hypothetical protein H0W44_07350 [Gammaproteobacteria bacterium]|nr:hypothetical protein [Gammaproteobacteria bacterium]